MKKKCMREISLFFLVHLAKEELLKCNYVADNELRNELRKGSDLQTEICPSASRGFHSSVLLQWYRL